MNIFEDIPCRDCGECTLRLEWRFEGRVNFRGHVTTAEWPWCVCDACGAQCRGKPDGSDETQTQTVEAFYQGAFRRE